MSLVQVFDDFSEYVQDVALSAIQSGFGTWRPTKGEVGSSIYDGMGFWGDHSVPLSALMVRTDAVCVPNSMFFRVTNLDTERAYIHSDREAGNYTAVLYLSEHDEPSGTAFFRHKPTGLIKMPSFEEMEALGIAEQLKEDMVSRDPDKWEEIERVEGKFNRAVVFDAPLFHSRFPIHGVGETHEEGRLVWACHFYKMDAKGRFF